MWLHGVILDNFRAFEHAEMTLPETGLVLVAGANNTGKSALVSALDVVAGDTGDITSVRHAGSEDRAQVTARFCLSDDERSKVLARTSRRNEWLASGAIKSLDFIFTENETLRMSGQAGLGLIEIRGTWTAHGVHALAQLDPAGGLTQVGSLAALTNDQDPAGMLISSQLAQPMWLDQALLNASTSNFLRVLLPAWRKSFYHFRALRLGTERTKPLASSSRLDPNGGNLSEVLLYLATDRPAIFRHLRNLIAEIVPHIGHLEVRTSGGQLRVVFEGVTRDLNLKDLGTGVEQLLMTLAVGLMEAPPFTLVVEEPETNLHPAGQRALLGHLQRWAEDRQIIAVTHSPVMLNWSPGGDRLWHVTRSESDSQVDIVDANPLPVLSSLGVQLSDILSADRVLVLEGPSDQDVLAVWFPEVLGNPRVAVLYGDGGDNARHADRLAEWLAGADRASLRRVLYLRDRDELSVRALDKLSRSPTVYLLTRRELENYLLDPAGIATGLASLKPPPKDLPTAEQVAEVMNDAADSLRTKIVVNRVCRQIGPSQPLIGHELRRQLARADADMGQITTQVLARMMTADDLRAQVADVWAEAEQDVMSQAGPELLAIAPGEEILNTVFRRFAGRAYDKRRDGPQIAKAISPPPEINEVFADFLAD
jgi:energy-coupling factor transporter ATP-binding protein EcfA2